MAARKIACFVLLGCLFGLNIHFHEAKSLTSFHLHDQDLALRQVQAPLFLGDGHLCPCHLATLDIPTLKAHPSAGSFEVNRELLSAPGSLLPLAWEIFHPPQAD